ncbi:MAG: cbb3-type cytochrome c oxidase subunit 3 [Alphaproteobacteria bacterium]|nr:cbb3-type cytochrome c oxidase subunit 3 [Alphaproteobacteria bacterium]
MTYSAMALVAETWGLAYLVVLFVGVLAYAFWPRNRSKFDSAAQIPLRDGEE